jgi:hypothetical protein
VGVREENQVCRVICICRGREGRLPQVVWRMEDCCGLPPPLSVGSIRDQGGGPGDGGVPGRHPVRMAIVEKAVVLVCRWDMVKLFSSFLG